MEQFYAYLAVTIGSIILTVGIFVGTTRTAFRGVDNTMKLMQQQLSEIRDDQKSIAELSTRVSVAETRLTTLEKCQDHIQTDMTILKKRSTKKGEE